MDGLIGGWVDGWMGGWVDGWMGGWVDTWMDTGGGWAGHQGKIHNFLRAARANKANPSCQIEKQFIEIKIKNKKKGRENY